MHDPLIRNNQSTGDATAGQHNAVSEFSPEYVFASFNLKGHPTLFCYS